MATISSPGIGSGLDVNTIVSKLMTIEQQPLTALAKKEAAYQSDISAYGTLRSKLSALHDASAALVPAIGQNAYDKFATFSASVADGTIASATTSGSTAIGSYSLEVRSLAQALGVASRTYAGGTSSPVANLVNPGDTANIAITLGGQTTNVVIGQSNNTLAGVRDAINAAGAGVTASIINSTGGSQLVITSTSTGAANEFSISGDVADLNFTPGSSSAYDPQNPPASGQGMAYLQRGADASVLFNGIQVTSSSNTFTNIVDGLNLTVQKQSASGTPTTVSVSRSSSGLTTQLQAFIKTYNDLNSSIHSLGSYDATTKQAGALNGDSTLRSIQSQLRAVINSTPTSLAGAPLQRLSDIGVSVQKDGSLALDTTKLQKALDNNTGAVANLVAAYGKSFSDASTSMTGSGGIIASRTDGINRMIKNIGNQRDALNVRLTQIEANYRAQFNALDTLVASMNQTSTYLQQQLAALTKTTG